LREQTSIPLVRLDADVNADNMVTTGDAKFAEQKTSRAHVDGPFLTALLEKSASQAFGSDIKAVHVNYNETPPISSAGQTCVYVLRRSDGWCYCGESDHLPSRLATHRQKSDRLIELTYVAIPKEIGGKSAARALESRVIQALNTARVPLWSDQDASHKNFGAAGA
jgi:predicted GIY-YIG superfamily endonuclease